MSTATINPVPAWRFADIATPEHAAPPAPLPIYDRLTERQRAGILSSFIRTETVLTDLPEQHNLSLDDLLDFFDDPRIQKALTRLERLASLRTRLAQVLNQHQAIETLRLVSSSYLATESQDHPPQSLPAHNTRNRQRETARRAAGTLLRSIPGAPPTPSPPRPALRPSRISEANPSSDHQPTPIHPQPNLPDPPFQQERPLNPRPNRSSPTLPPCPPTSSAPSSPPNSPA
jgi:hypothetical protein